MQLSIIIVNYNVKYFLEQCLFAVNRAIKNISSEVFIVDNASADNSVVYLQPVFPHFIFIQNKNNIGFGKANNIAVEKAKGKYILFLNPDTIVPEDAFEKCMQFFEKEKSCGALGVKMLDGKGVFLPESKRAFPGVLTSFFKLTGLARVFPTSALFNKYALGNLSAHKNHVVDVLAGAFMMVRKDVLQKTGAFDEDFFMYGEDVDLSYRIQQAGYKNYYFAETAIIHFKGESTKRGSYNYVKMFYEAMNIFVKKHYKNGSAAIFAFFIQFAIWIRAIITLLQSMFTKWGLAVLEATAVYATFFIVEKAWVHIFRDGGKFDVTSLNTTIPVFAFLYVLTGFLTGMYDNLYKPKKALFSFATAVLVLLAAYSLFPEKYRFSRGVIIVGAIASAFVITVLRWFLLKLELIKNNETEEQRFQQTIIVGSNIAYNKVMSILTNAGLQERILGRIGTEENDEKALGSWNNFKEILPHLMVKEVIFCTGSITNAQIIQTLQYLPKNINYRFFDENSNSIVGSDSKATSGETITKEGYFLITTPYQQRMKRLLDIALSVIIFFTFPIQIFVKRNFWQLLKNTWQVLMGKKTWVGYILPISNELPNIKSGVINNYGLNGTTPHNLNLTTIQTLNMAYARHYDWLKDLSICLKYYKNLS